MSPEDWQKWNDNQKHEGDINSFMKWAYILVCTGVFVYVFASSMN